DDYFIVVSDSPLLDSPGLEPLRKKLLETALRYYQDFIRLHAASPAFQADVAAAHLRISQITYLNGEPSDALFPHMREGVDIIERLIADGQDTPEVQKRLGKLYLGGGDLGYAVGGTVDHRDILRYLHKVAAIQEKFIRDNPTEPAFASDLAGTYCYLASTY